MGQYQASLPGRQSNVVVREVSAAQLAVQLNNPPAHAGIELLCIETGARHRWNGSVWRDINAELNALGDVPRVVTNELTGRIEKYAGGVLIETTVTESEYAALLAGDDIVPGCTYKVIAD